MAVHEHPHRSPGFHRPSFRRNRTALAPESAVSARTGTHRHAPARTGTHTAQGYLLASLRLLTGFVFLWAFLDKTCGLGHPWAGLPLVRDSRWLR